NFIAIILIEVIKLSIFISTFQTVPLLIFYAVIIFIVVLYLKDKLQHQHSILKTHPILGRLRYVFEMIGPEMRQYWILNVKEGKAVDCDISKAIAKTVSHIYTDV